MSDETPYEVCDPATPGTWRSVFGVWNAWAAVREVLKDTQYDPRTFGPARVFQVRYGGPTGSLTSVRVVVPAPRFEVQIGRPWKAAPR